MPNLSIRGLDPGSLSALKALAAQENSSVNTLVLRLIDRGLGKTQSKPTPHRFDDLDALAGCWSAADANAFAAATVAFDRIDPDIWK